MFNLSNYLLIKNAVSSISNKATIIAVSKSFPIDYIRTLIDHGHNHFGENKVQEAQSKWTDVLKERSNIKLHMIGKLQSNKAKDAFKIFDYIQCGLGVIFSRHENNYSNFTYNFMKHYGFAIDIEVKKFQTDNLYDFLNNKKKSINFDNLELMDIKKNIVRLLKKIEY